MLEKNIQNTPDTNQSLAAVDLGSNSFHMIITRLADDGSIQVIDKIKEMVRLGAGLDNTNNLSDEAQTRALDCLQRFGERLREVKASNVRIVGTNTLRIAKNSTQFLARARELLGHNIEIISGIEEARLIYLGVSHSLALTGDQRLVVDIGGGSTECIIGQQFSPIKLESLYMGCVNMTRRFFADGKLTKEQFKKANIAASVELEKITYNYKKTGWDQAVGASGSIKSISKVLFEEGITDNYKITLKALKKLEKILINFESIDTLSLKGLDDERKPVFIGGFVVLHALFKALDINEMDVSDGAVREGLIYDILGRIKQEDVRETTVVRFMERFSVDIEHANNVSTTAVNLFNKVKKEWNLDVIKDYENVLRWGALLHETGLTIAHAGYHKHGAYLTQNADMPGFSFQAQQIVAMLIRSHRQKFPVADFNSLPEQHISAARYLAFILRIAVILRRNRESVEVPDVNVFVTHNSMKLQFPEKWFKNHQLSRADLKQEQLHLVDTDFALEFS